MWEIFKDLVAVGIFATISTWVGYLVAYIRVLITDSPAPKGFMGYSLWILQYLLVAIVFILLVTWWFA
jgi:hypothetical protein